MSYSIQEIILWLTYLFGSITFIFGLKRLSHPETAKRGNLLAAVGMTVAILGTIFLYKDHNGERLHNYIWIFGGIIIGTIVGTMAARRVKMTAMPQMVSLFNGMGGACAAIISIVEYQKYEFSGWNIAAVTLAGLLIGGISFAGSMLAFGKLNGNVSDRVFPGQSIINMIVLLATIGLGTYLTISPEQHLMLLSIMIAMCLLYGVLFVLPIGGADMPVVISLLNSFTGVAAACGGFIYNNQVMLTGGILVGSAGTILTILMCKAMNRSLLNVIIGNFGGKGAATSEGGKDKGNVKEISIADAAVLLSYSKKVLVVPGYGLAVAQAQHMIHELEQLLEEKGVEVKYAIHPVAGRMPGHMNVLLAEADVPYDKLLEMEDANSEFKTTNAVIVIGANDVVNPAAKNDKASPIYGMPILEVDNAENVIVMKRSMNSGYAGIENELFYEPKTRMLFGDAKASLQKLVAEVKAN
jgi:NAD(P) transhydrogenase subunit beta